MFDLCHTFFLTKSLSNHALPILSINIKHNFDGKHENQQTCVPALMKGSGKPVGGIEPDNISYCTTINLLNIVLTHSHNLAPFAQDCKANFLFLFFLYILKDFFLL